ncbi:MAG TPA: DUF4276 family protein [Candidatus Obscuribacterales bacterium]
MVREIRIYAEGGGDRADTKTLLRKGFNKFLEPLIDIARSKGISWRFIPCGSRREAFDDFTVAVRTYDDAFVALLVDSEAAVAKSPKAHLESRPDEKVILPDLPDDHFHLMVQSMETWIVADIDILKDFYKHNFASLPKTQDIEQVDRHQLENQLKLATRLTQKGEYQKIRHAAKLLELLRPSVVRQRCRHCDRFFVVVAEKMGSTV